MSRVRRVDVGGEIYHALNRANFRARLFRTDAHDRDFLGIGRKGLLTFSPRASRLPVVFCGPYGENR